MKYPDYEHNCEFPSTEGLPHSDNVHWHRTVSTFKCPECGRRWKYGGYFGGFGKFKWTYDGRASRRWRKQEHLRRTTGTRESEA